MKPPTTCDLCPRPTRDHAHVCAMCADAFAAILRDLADWLEAELENSLHGTKGIEYKADKAIGGSPGELRVNWAVGEIQRKLVTALDAIVWHCDRVKTPSSDHAERPMKRIGEMAAWLRYRVDGLALDPEGARLMDRVNALVARAKLMVDRPADHEYLGQCGECKRGRLYAIAGSATAKCELCRAEYDSGEMRDWLLDELDDRLVTAAEVARLSTYLGLSADREKVRKRVNQWHRRGRIEAHESVLGDAAPEALFRFGDVYKMLVAEDRARGV